MKFHCPVFVTKYTLKTRIDGLGLGHQSYLKKLFKEKLSYQAYVLIFSLIRTAFLSSIISLVRTAFLSVYKNIFRLLPWHIKFERHKVL